MLFAFHDLPLASSPSSLSPLASVRSSSGFERHGDERKSFAQAQTFSTIPGTPNKYLASSSVGAAGISSEQLAAVPLRHCFILIDVNRCSGLCGLELRHSLTTWAVGHVYFPLFSNTRSRGFDGFLIFSSGKVR